MEKKTEYVFVAERIPKKGDFFYIENLIYEAGNDYPKDAEVRKVYSRIEPEEKKRKKNA